MTTRQKFISLYTMLRNEVRRIFRIWTQTLIPPLITNTMYFVIFGGIVGSQVANMNGVKYMEYILPGIIMMGVILSAFMHSVSSYYFSKFQRTIEEIVVSPTPYYIVLLGYTIGGVIRGFLIATLIALVGIFFTDIHIHSYILMCIMVILTSAFFALLGITNGIFAKSFDGISIIPNFFITPLTYLGGVFYSIKLLPPFWQALSQFNPILYMVDGFRFSMLGVSDINIFYSLVLLTTLVVVFFGVNLYFFRSGRGFRL